jgi:hypothetical protein
MTNNFKSIARSFIIVPMLATSMTMSTVTTVIQSAVIEAQKEAISMSAEELEAQKQREITAAKIDAYFAQYNLPLAGHGMTFVLEAEKNGIPATLVAAIGMAESTGCKFVIKHTNNCWGWNHGRIKFTSIEEAIVQISANLGGNDPDTARYYKGKSTKQIINTYNPPRVAPEYEGKIMHIMRKIDAMPA